MPTNAFYSGVDFKIGDGGDPTETFTTLEEVTELSGFGEIQELIEVTHFGSNGSKEYIAGLADGKEFTATCNHVVTGGTQQAYVKTNQGNVNNIQIDITDGTTTQTYDFASVFMGWELGPSNSDKNTITFTFKISGGITES